MNPSYHAKVALTLIVSGAAGYAAALYEINQKDIAMRGKAGAAKAGSKLDPKAAIKPADAAEPWKYLAVYLSPESRSNLQRQLSNLGIGKTHEVGNRVIVKSSLSAQDTYLYEPLFGERAAFRIKGIVKAEGNDLVAGLGRVSTVAGELLDDDCEASITLYPKPAAALSEGGAVAPASAPTTLDEQKAMDLPTRLKRANVVQDKLSWQGLLPARRVLSRDYPAERATFTGYSFVEQVVVDGRICSSDLVDENGGCIFDKSSLSSSDVMPPADHSLSSSDVMPPADHSADASVSVSSPPAAAPAAAAGKVADEAAEAAGEGLGLGLGLEAAGEKEAAECPVCRFMKSGPCKEPFLVWDACVQGIKEDGDVTECFPSTVEMMKCMREYEYYDIMTANSSDKMMQAEVASQAKEISKEEGV